MLERSFDAYQRAIDISPTNGFYLGGRGRVRVRLAELNLGSNADAERDLTAAVRRAPSQALLRRALVRFHVGRGQIAGAEEQARALAGIDGENAVDAFLDVGDAYYRRNNGEKAGEMFREALKINPRSAKALYNLGVYHYRRRELDSAAELFQRSAAADPDFTLSREGTKRVLERRQLMEKQRLEALAATPATRSLEASPATAPKRH
jgi:tetratricopeptide (TPR) repeat protein